MEPEGSLPYSKQPARHLSLSWARSIQSIPPTHQFHFSKIHSNIILQFTPGPFKWFPSVRFPHQNSLGTPPSPIRAACPVHFRNMIIFYGEELLAFLPAPNLEDHPLSVWVLFVSKSGVRPSRLALNGAFTYGEVLICFNYSSRQYSLMKW